MLAKESSADKYEKPNMREILVRVVQEMNYETGGARQAAVAQQPMHVWKVRFLKICPLYPDDS